MRHLHWTHQAAAIIACVGMISPSHHLQAEETASASPAAGRTGAQMISDVRMASGGKLRGRLLDAQGQPEADKTVTFRNLALRNYSVVTDANGRFALVLSNAGVYHVSAEHGSQICRVWTNDAAPPHANDELLIVSGETVTRAASEPFKALLNNKYLLGTLILIAVAVPIAVSNNRDNRISS
jgi:hypothetical protein